MKNDFFGFDGIDDQAIRAERNKARQLRRSRWWQRKTSSGTCYYCGRKVGIKALTMDHIIPLSRGGRSTRDNLVPCCKACNTRKKSSLPVEWEEYMEHLSERSAETTLEKKESNG
ncbi:MAG TPA: HNH endonuclease [Desulfobulbus sp.]|nr:HNH endonuclease [Desulfobulbus sp.]